MGPITEADISNAVSTNAVILGFDVPCSGPVEKKAEAAQITVRLHKLIYKFTDDVEDLVHDANLKEALARGQGMVKETIGQADIQ